MKKKFLALVMTLSMVLSLVPMTALATEEGTAPAIQEGQSVGADATGNSSEGDAGTSDTPNDNPTPGGNDTGDSENSEGDASQNWKVDKENKTIEIYNATGLRAWANSIGQTNRNTEKDPNYGDTIYDGYTMEIINDIDLSDSNWTSVLRLGGTFTINGNDKVISNMNIDEERNGSGGNTYLGFIGDLAYKARLTVKNLTFENAHVQETEGDKQKYSWCGVVVGHGPMDCVSEANAECMFENVTVNNSVVTGGHNNAAILGYASSTERGHVFKNCSVNNTFIGGYNSTSAILFSGGYANIAIENCSAEGVRMYSDGLTFGNHLTGNLIYNSEQYNGNLWTGIIYHDTADNKNEVSFSGTNTLKNTSIVYPVKYHYADGKTVEKYVTVNEALDGKWFSDSSYKTAVSSIDGRTMYPAKETAGHENQYSYDTQDTDVVDNPFTHAAINLYTRNRLIPLEPIDPGDQDTPFLSKSKVATNLDSLYESNVTLSLPSAQENLVTDVVFVLDESSCTQQVKENVNSMLEQLYSHIENTGAKIKIGAVQFRGNVCQLNLTELNEKTKDSVTEFMSTRPDVGGSNMNAGLLAAQKMLKADIGVDDGRKYVILVSDGITYIWDDETTENQENYGVNSVNRDSTKPTLANPQSWDIKYYAKYIPTDWTMHFSEIQPLVDKTIKEKASIYIRNVDFSDEPYVTYEEKDSYASTVDIALYKSYEAYQALASKYHTYSVCAGNEDEMEILPWGPSFMEYLANGEEVSFEQIQNEIIYLLDNGSYVSDYMGYVEGDYNFDFINDASRLMVTIGKGESKETLKAEEIGENRYGFGPMAIAQTLERAAAEISGYRYVLEYVPGEKKDDEHFIWHINAPVSNFAPVALTYSVKLVNPKSASGTYGQYDADGSKKYSGLYTNNSATLYPMDSQENEGIPENFLKPTVSYTVSGGGGGGGGGGSITIPDDVPTGLDLKNHYGYIIGYPVDYYTGKPTTDQTKKPVRPEGKITRAEVATIYFRMLTDENRAANWNQVSGFSDVKSSAWYNNAISTLTKAGILKGYEDGTFQPNGYITRAEFATIAIRFFSGVYEGEDLFPDIKGHWAEDYINNAANKGLVKGYEDGTFGPDRYITRAEAVTLVNRTLNRHPHNDGLHQDMLRWPDNMDTSKWYYADMQEATNSHEPDKNKTTADKEYWGKMLPIRDWEALEKEWSNANSAPGEGEVV